MTPVQVRATRVPLTITPETHVEVVRATPVHKWNWPLEKKIWCLAILTHVVSTAMAVFAVAYTMNNKCKCN